MAAIHGQAADSAAQAKAKDGKKKIIRAKATAIHFQAGLIDRLVDFSNSSAALTYSTRRSFIRHHPRDVCEVLNFMLYKRVGLFTATRRKHNA